MNKVHIQICKYKKMEPRSRFELETPSLPWKCSTTELRRRLNYVEAGFPACMQNMVLEVGLEPTKAEAERFTVSCHCH